MARATGSKAEERAAAYLLKKGYRILRRNYRSKTAEIDIIAKDGPTIVFVEVKSRTSTAFGSPVEAVDAKKQKKMKQAALQFLCGGENEAAPARFDVIAISPGGALEHITDAFDS